MYPQKSKNALKASVNIASHYWTIWNEKKTTDADKRSLLSARATDICQSTLAPVSCQWQLMAGHTKFYGFYYPNCMKMINVSTNANPRGRSTDSLIVFFVVLYKIDLLRISQIRPCPWWLWAALCVWIIIASNEWIE